MIQVITLTLTIATGIASQYAPSHEAYVLDYRQSRGEIPPDISMYHCFIAVAEAADIGRTFWVRPVGTGIWTPCLAVDCASKSDARKTDGLSGYAWMRRNNVLIEIVNWDLVQRWHTERKMLRVEMVRYNPAMLKRAARIKRHFYAPTINIEWRKQ